MADSIKRITLIPAEPEHLELLFAWRQDRELMRFLPTFPEHLTWEEHWEWWINRENRLDWMISMLGQTYEVRYVGTVHYNAITHEIGIIVGEKTMQGQGVARKALRHALGRIPHLWCIAVIHPDNIASQRVFASVGFKKTDEDARNGQEKWMYQS